MGAEGSHGKRPAGIETLRRPLLLQVDGTPGLPARGLAGIGLVVRWPAGGIITSRCLRAPAQTCNEAEYQALIAGLELMHSNFAGVAVRCMSDSRVVVDQITGRCRVRAGPLEPLYARAMTLVAQFAQLEIVAIPRELNRLADALAWEALSGRRQIRNI
jgi:ribonuclease HI